MADVTWGDTIYTRGEKPVWANGPIEAQWFGKGYSPDWTVGADRIVMMPADWHNVHSVKLPADHWVYTVLRYNEQHGTNFTPWGGGERAPDDWDGCSVLMDGPVGEMSRVGSHDQWRNTHPTLRTVIGYTRRVEPPAHMTEREAREHGADDVLVEAMRAAGILREPTLVERFKAERGDWALLDRSELIDCVLTWSATQ